MTGYHFVYPGPYIKYSIRYYSKVKIIIIYQINALNFSRESYV